MSAVGTEMAVVVAHYHRRGLVRSDLADLLGELDAMGAETVFVSTNLSGEGAKSLPNRTRVIERENHGYDFYSYKQGLAALDRRLLRRIVLMNSSFLCADRRKLLERFFAHDHRAWDVFGLTFSLERSRHLQSFLLSFSRRCFESGEFYRWWSELQPIDERDRVIEECELGLSRFLERAGFSLGAAFRPTPMNRAIALWRSIRRIRPVLNPATLNPTQFYWDFLLGQFGIVKIEMLKKNPYRLISEQSRRRLATLAGPAGLD